MAVDTKGFRVAHDELRERTAQLRFAAECFPTLDKDAREDVRGHIVTSLRDDVQPHMKLDELLLYPEVAKRFGEPLAAASMNYDHIAIRDWIEKIAAADAGDTSRMQELLYGLDALIRVHLWKENELFLASLDSPSWPAPG
jgi:hypothetical protein